MEEPARCLTHAQRETLRALADTILPAGGAVKPGAVELGVVEALEQHLTRCQPSARNTVRLMLTALNLGSVASRTPAPFRHLGGRARQAYVHACETSGIRQRRETLVALKALLLMFYAEAPEVAAAIGFDGRPFKAVTHDPGPVALHVEAPTADVMEAADVVIVGSGAGGAVVARELSEAGLRVIVLEEGAHHDRREFHGPLPERLRRLYRGNGLTFTFGVPVISLPMGRGVGGSTLINSGTCFRTPPSVLRHWSEESGLSFDEDELAPLFERVEQTLNVRAVSDEIMGPNGALLEQARHALGMSGGPIRRNERGCHGHGVCAFGCPLDAKMGTHVSYLPLAQRAGARILSGCRVESLILESGHAAGVRGVVADPETGATRGSLEVRAAKVVLAAGAIHTPALLLRQRLGNRAETGRHLRIHPGCGVLAVFDRDLVGWRGVMQSAHVDERLSDGILLEATYPPPGVGYSAGGLPQVGPALKEMLSEYRRTAALGSIISDSGTGRVRRGPGREPLMFYSLGRADLAKVLGSIRLAAELYLAAGAREVHTMLPGFPPVRKSADLDGITGGRWRAADLKLSAYHPMGTCRMGSDPARSVVDAHGHVHGVPGLVIADASVLPGSTAVNPQISIMALATRTAMRMADEMRPRGAEV